MVNRWFTGTPVHSSRCSKARNLTAEMRRAVAGLTLSAAALVGIVLHEGYTDHAVIPAMARTMAPEHPHAQLGQPHNARNHRRARRAVE